MWNFCFPHKIVWEVITLPYQMSTIRSNRVNTNFSESQLNDISVISENNINTNIFNKNHNSSDFPRMVLLKCISSSPFPNASEIDKYLSREIL